MVGQIRMNTANNWIYFGYGIVALGFVVGYLMIFHGNRLNSRAMEQRLTEQTKISENSVKEHMTKSLDQLLASINWKSRDEDYKEAKRLADLANLYMNQGKNKDAAEVLRLFRNIAARVNDYNAAAGASIIAAWRYQDIGEYKMAADLMIDAANFYYKLNENGEAALWKKEAAKLLKKGAGK